MPLVTIDLLGRSARAASGARRRRRHGSGMDLEDCFRVIHALP